MHWEEVSRGELAGEVVFWANAVRIRGSDVLDEVLAEQVSAIVEASEPAERAVLQLDRAKFLEQPAAHLLGRQSLRPGGGLPASQSRDCEQCEREQRTARHPTASRSHFEHRHLFDLRVRLPPFRPVPFVRAETAL